MTNITLEQARAVLTAALAASEATVPVSIAVVDTGGHLKAFDRVDGANLGGVDVAIRKARTAQLFEMPTGTLGKDSQPGGALFNIELTNGGLVTFPGGIPLTVDGTLIGAIGVSGGTPDEDEHIAAAGVKAL